MAKILVVDDDPSDRELMRSILERDGHRVTVATGGRDALDTLSSTTFDAVVTDILMPDVNGADLIEEMHRRVEGYTPVVVVTGGGSGDPTVVLRSIEHLGVTASLEKPFELAALTDTVRDVLGWSSGAGTADSD